MNIDNVLKNSLSFAIGLYALIGLVFGVVRWSILLEQGNLISYFAWFFFIPALIAWLCIKRMWLVLTPWYFAAQFVRPLNSDSWLPSNPPVSLGWAFGDFSVGQGRLLDGFALMMALLLFAWWWRSKKLL